MTRHAQPLGTFLEREGHLESRSWKNNQELFEDGHSVLVNSSAQSPK